MFIDPNSDAYRTLNNMSCFHKKPPNPSYYILLIKGSIHARFMSTN